VVTHGDAREGKWRGNWQMEWVASTLHTTSERGVSSITTADAHTSAASIRLNWRPLTTPTDLNGLVRFVKIRNLVTARVPSRFKRSLRFVYSMTLMTVCLLKSTTYYNALYLPVFSPVLSLYLSSIEMFPAGTNCQPTSTFSPSSRMTDMHNET